MVNVAMLPPVTATLAMHIYAAPALCSRARAPRDKQQVPVRQVEREFGIPSGEGLRIEGEADPEKLDAALDAVLFAGSKGEVRSRLVRPGAAAS